MKVGILGGGQLGRMMALAGYPLGLRFRFLDPSPDAPGGQVGEHICASYDDAEALKKFADGIDVATYEFENVPAASAAAIRARVPLYPPPEALATAQDRLIQKNWFKTLDIATAPFADADNRRDLERAVADVGLPAVIKTRRFGYDGKGQFVLRSWHELDAAWKAVGGLSAPDGKLPLIVEGFVSFQRELSIIAARGRDGSTVFYPVVENHHRGGILRLTIAPAPDISSALQAEAERMASRVFDALHYVGVLTIELFQHEGKLLANEMATRVHNSGHWSIEGAVTSQFENHVRAVCGLPLGSCSPLPSREGVGGGVSGVTAMVNLIGDTPDAAQVLAQNGMHLHLYGKSGKAPGRKLGHITLTEPDLPALNERLKVLAGLPGAEFPLPTANTKTPRH
ncbi:MAG TPA: 5-(carboxyamino)imidazole ribonucleotide synthase [Planctomycetota bacterium]|nr:5-(carboxyamino)imidazole ribonucleotide synthase [Planctomycetota bacterium]